MTKSKASRAPTHGRSFMSGADYRATLAALGLSIRGSAKFLRIGERTSRRRANEQAPIDWETAALLRLMADQNVKPNYVAALVEPGEKCDAG